MFLFIISSLGCHEFCYIKNNGSYGMTKLFNSQLCSIIELVYLSDGDIINFESHGIMALWKVRKFDLAFKTVELVIKCALTFKEMCKNINNITPTGFKCKILLFKNYSLLLFIFVSFYFINNKYCGSENEYFNR